MKSQNQNVLNALRFYTFLLKFYPKYHQQVFGSQMLQTFKDHYNDILEHEDRVGVDFWLEVVSDEVKGIVREHIETLNGKEYSMNKYALGLGLGILMSVAVVVTNVVFPTQDSDSEYQMLYLITYLGLFFLFGVGGYLASKGTRSLQSGAVGGAVTAFLSIGLTMLTFIIIDNLFLDIVSQQPDKIWGFQHQQAFHTMRAYINHGLLTGVLSVLPGITLLGALLGAIGAGIRKWNFGKYSKSSS
jgi:hypothetical protein